ncbi:MAG: hypothetical protein ACR2GH_17675 [Pseudonocardia sp.]
MNRLFFIFIAIVICLRGVTTHLDMMDRWGLAALVAVVTLPILRQLRRSLDADDGMGRVPGYPGPDPRGVVQGARC